MTQSTTALSSYTAQLAKYQPLTEEQEKEADRDTLVLHSLRYVVLVVKQYAYTEDQMLDYIQEGNLALFTAAESFDPAKGNFCSWATGYIKNRVRMAQFFNRCVVKLPRDAYTYHHRIRNLLAEGVSEDCICSQLKIHPRIIDIVRQQDPMAELDYNEPYEENELPMVTHSVMKAIAKYPTDKQKRVLELRFQGLTHQAIADRLGITYQGVQRLEKNGIKAITGAVA